MLGLLTEKMQTLISKLSGKSKLTEDNISDAMSDVRMALLEADVNYAVVKNLLKRVKESVLGDAVIKSVTPGQQFVKVLHDELVLLMGQEPVPLSLKKEKGPSVIMVCGLQGSGKTTACVKLARYLKKNKLAKSPLIAACDLQRPAAVEQLKILASQIEVPVFSIEGEKDPVKVAKLSKAEAVSAHHDVLIVDTAGRLHIDEELMQQLTEVKAVSQPDEILFVANAAFGQDAVNTAAEFNKKVPLTGTILTMLDGSARGGAAISIREVTGKPLKFEGTGEKVDDLQLFNPTSMAHRILGMGDTINLVRKAQESISEEDAKNLEKKIKDASFTYNDFLTQIGMVKKMGSLKGLLGMLPGMSQLKDLNFDEKEFYKTEAMIQSMTKLERDGKCELVHSRRLRIAKGSGTKVDDVNRLVKSFDQAKKFFKNMPKGFGSSGKMPDLQKLMGLSK